MKQISFYHDRSGDMWVTDGIMAQAVSWEDGIGSPMFLPAAIVAFGVQKKLLPRRPHDEYSFDRQPPNDYKKGL